MPSKLFTLVVAGSLAALSTFAAVGCAAPTVEEEEEMGESEGHLLAGKRFTPGQVATYLRAAGFAEKDIGKLVCTAKYESQYYQRASNKNRNGSTDRGLFQINSIHLGSMKGCPTKAAAESLYDPETNTKCALAVFKAQGINAWYGYRAHKSECNRTKAPGSAAIDANDDGEADVPTPTPRPNPTDTSGTVVDTDEPAADIDPNDDYELGAGCWSATKQDMMAPLSCVEQKDTRVWFQCKEGKWYRGGSDVQGPYGYCNGSFPL